MCLQPILSVAGMLVLAACLDSRTSTWFHHTSQQFLLPFQMLPLLFYVVVDGIFLYLTDTHIYLSYLMIMQISLLLLYYCHIIIFHIGFYHRWSWLLSKFLAIDSFKNVMEVMVPMIKNKYCSAKKFLQSLLKYSKSISDELLVAICWNPRLLEVLKWRSVWCSLLHHLVLGKMIV